MKKLELKLSALPGASAVMATLLAIAISGFLWKCTIAPQMLRKAQAADLVPIEDTTLHLWTSTAEAGKFWGASTLKLRSEEFAPIAVAIMRWDPLENPAGGGVLSLTFEKRTNTNRGAILVYQTCWKWSSVSRWDTLDAEACYMYGDIIGRFEIPDALPDGTVIDIPISGFDPGWGVMIALASDGAVEYQFSSREGSHPPVLCLRPAPTWPVSVTPSLTPKPPTLTPTLTPTPTIDIYQMKCIVCDDLLVCVAKLTPTP